MNQQEICQQNRDYEGTAGVSKNNRRAGFLPAFRDDATGRVELARMADGSAATMHVITWLPPEWAETRDTEGGVVQLRDSIICGFVRDGTFYTRDEVARLVDEA